MSWFKRRSEASTPEQSATAPGPGATLDLGAFVGALSARIEALEAAFPAYRLEMVNLVDQAEDILKRSGQRQDRARQAETRAERRSGNGPAGEVDLQSEEYRAQLARGEVV